MSHMRRQAAAGGSHDTLLAVGCASRTRKDDSRSRIVERGTRQQSYGALPRSA